MPPSFHPLPADVEPSAADILRDITERLAAHDSGREARLFDEVVFAGVGEPLLRWPVVKEVVRSLRHRHADLLLRPHQPPPTSVAAAAAGALGRTELDSGKGTAPFSNSTMPVRLVTNGVWPVASGHELGSCCPTVRVSGSAGTPPEAAAATAERFLPRGRRRGGWSGRDEGDRDSAAQAERRSSQDVAGGGPAGRGGSNAEADASAASTVASEIAELFDSVSVALNTADPMQYEELMKPSAHGLIRTQAHGLVCDLVTECVAQGLPTECTVVDRDAVDVGRVQELAAALGASCRVRPYCP
eukprot:g12741.t1